MPKSLRCSCCGTQAIDRGEPLEPEGWYEPFCPTCQKPLTCEGLLIELQKDGSERFIREIGKGGEVIWKYGCRCGGACQPMSEDAERLLRTLAQLEERAKSLGKAVVIIRAYEISWNRKAAARRFRRWFDYEYGKEPIEIENDQLRELANRTLNSDGTREPDYEQLYRDMIEDGKYLDEIYGYEERKSLEPALVLRDLPEGTRAILREAQEAYRWGLSRSVLAVCRAVLEDVVRQVLATHGLEGTAIPMNQESLEILLKCLPDHVLDSSGRELAHRVRKAGNNALHQSDNSYTEQPIQILWTTMALVKSLLEQVNRS